MTITQHWFREWLGKGKGKVSVLSPHPGSELCSADFDKYLPWPLGLYSPYIHLDIHLNSLGSIQPLTRNFAPRLTNLPSQVPICSWAKRSNAAWSALLRGKTSRRTGRVLNSELDLNPNPESCTLPLDQLAAAWHRLGDKQLSEPMLTWVADAYMRYKGEMCIATGRSFYAACCQIKHNYNSRNWFSPFCSYEKWKFVCLSPMTTLTSITRHCINKWLSVCNGVTDHLITVFIEFCTMLISNVNSLINRELVLMEGVLSRICVFGTSSLPDLLPKRWLGVCLEPSGQQAISLGKIRVSNDLPI